MMHRYLNDLSVTLSEWVNTLIIFSIAIIFYVCIIVEPLSGNKFDNNWSFGILL